ncbi:hypothetical protein PR048_016899 [Dryococelus australis]|uniref:Uncharacterized protein n=1 Tax=Dryococelus australis TaxID=614101 RepID=A0ABQ9H813_9NEOP|nr:hypothetical protein PR048_016899 [Dryococelus australis]
MSRICCRRTEVTGSSFVLEARSSIPKLFYEGSYTCNAKTLLFPVDWSGKFNMTMGEFNAWEEEMLLPSVHSRQIECLSAQSRAHHEVDSSDVSSTLKLTANLVNKGERTFLDLQDVSFDFNVNAFNTHATGLFWGNEELGNFALKMVNKHWRSFSDTMWKLAKPHVFKKVSDAISAIFSKTPVTRLSSNQLPFVSDLKPSAN